MYLKTRTTPSFLPQTVKGSIPREIRKVSGRGKNWRILISPGRRVEKEAKERREATRIFHDIGQPLSRMNIKEEEKSKEEEDAKS